MNELICDCGSDYCKTCFPETALCRWCDESHGDKDCLTRLSADMSRKLEELREADPECIDALLGRYRAI